MQLQKFIGKTTIALGCASSWAAHLTLSPEEAFSGETINPPVAKTGITPVRDTAHNEFTRVNTRLIRLLEEFKREPQLTANAKFEQLVTDLQRECYADRERATCALKELTTPRHLLPLTKMFSSRYLELETKERLHLVTQDLVNRTLLEKFHPLSESEAFRVFVHRSQDTEVIDPDLYKHGAAITQSIDFLSIVKMAKNPEHTESVISTLTEALSYLNSQYGDKLNLLFEIEQILDDILPREMIASKLDICPYPRGAKRMLIDRCSDIVMGQDGDTALVRELKRCILQLHAFHNPSFHDPESPSFLITFHSDKQKALHGDLLRLGEELCGCVRTTDFRHNWKRTLEPLNEFQISERKRIRETLEQYPTITSESIDSFKSSFFQRIPERFHHK